MESVAHSNITDDNMSFKQQKEDKSLTHGRMDIFFFFFFFDSTCVFAACYNEVTGTGVTSWETVVGIMPVLEKERQCKQLQNINKVNEEGKRKVKDI